MTHFKAVLSNKGDTTKEKNIEGSVSDKANECDIEAWLNKNYPDHTVKSIRLTSKEVQE